MSGTSLPASFPRNDGRPGAGAIRESAHPRRALQPPPSIESARRLSSFRFSSSLAFFGHRSAELLGACLSGLLLLGGCAQETVWFCPADGCAQALVDEINASTLSVHVAIAYFTHDDIADALIEAHARGIEVKVIGEGSEYTADGINYTIVNKLVAAGVDYRDDGNSATMHNKVTVIDGQVVMTGSFNYTQSADTRNNENLVRLSSANMADAYEAEFARLWEEAKH